MEIAVPTSPSDGSPSSNRDGTGKPKEGVSHGADTDLRRTLSTRHLTMIALGSSIGMGLWLGSGTSLRNGGPAAMFLGYVLAGTIIWSVSQGIAELAILYPVPSAYVQWASTFISPAVGFAVGWAYCLSSCITLANELQGVVTVLNFWTRQVPTAAWISVFWVVIILINIWAVKLFGEVEVVSSTIKFFWIFVVIISLTVVSAGGAPSEDPIGFRYWNAEPFTNGFKGFLSVIPTCIFAMGGSESAAIVAAETQNPRKSVPRAIGSIWVRLSLFYVLGSLAITITVDPQDPNLFGGSGENNSPFVVAYQKAGIPVLAHIMNAVIFISVVSSGSVATYSGSRTLMGLSHLRMAPKIFSRADRAGRPVAGLFVILLLGGGLAYLNVSNKGSDVFGWFSSLTSLLSLFGWGSICISHLRMRYAWKVQGRPDSDLPWRAWSYPYSSCWGLACCIILIAVEFYLSVWPLHTEPNAKDFFANYVTVLLLLVLYIGARCWYRGPWWVDASKIDLDGPRRFYAHEDEEARPKGIREVALGLVFR